MSYQKSFNSVNKKIVKSEKITVVSTSSLQVKTKTYASTNITKSSIGSQKTDSFKIFPRETINQNVNPFQREFGTNDSSIISNNLNCRENYVSPYTGNVIRKISDKKYLSMTPTEPKSGTTSSSRYTILNPKITLMTSKNDGLPTELNSNSKEKIHTFKSNDELFKKNRQILSQGQGVCYIFNHENFNTKENYRAGSQDDVILLRESFERFKVKVTVFKDLTKKRIHEEIIKIQNKDFSKNSCIVIVILSHGNRLEMIRAKDEIYSIDDDILFPIIRNKTLDSKPKILLIQACKGDINPLKLETDSVRIQPYGNPSEIIKCYSTFEGYVAYRTSRGSIFIKIFCELFKMYGQKKDIKEIMEMVIQRVKTETRDLQIPSIQTTLTKSYIFGDYV